MIERAGADAIGLNFYERSQRFVDLSEASKIVERLSADVKRVGVFVNASSEAIFAAAHRIGLDYVQLHGDEPPQFLSELPGLQIIRAFRGAENLQLISDYLSECERRPVAVLVDAHDPIAYGGTGRTLYWPDLAKAAEFTGQLPLILAGGLTPANVAEAIQQARPFGVDTASGVEQESRRGKDAALCQAFVSAAKAAFSRNPDL